MLYRATAAASPSWSTETVDATVPALGGAAAKCCSSVLFEVGGTLKLIISLPSSGNVSQYTRVSAGVWTKITAGSEPPSSVPLISGAHLSIGLRALLAAISSESFLTGHLYWMVGPNESGCLYYAR